MSNSITILSKDIRVIDGLYSLNDLHKASGNEAKYKPSNFVRLDQTQELIKEIDQGSDVSLALKSIHGGIGRGTYVCEDLVYAYAMWISAKFSLIVIRAFKAMQKPIPQITTQKITEEQRGILFDIVATRSGKNGSLRAKMWGALKSHFRYSSYHDLLVIHFEEAKHLLESMDLHSEQLATNAFNILPEGRFLVTNQDGKITTIDATGKCLVPLSATGKCARDLMTLATGFHDMALRLQVLLGEASSDRLDVPLSLKI